MELNGINIKWQVNGMGTNVDVLPVNIISPKATCINSEPLLVTS